MLLTTEAFIGPDLNIDNLKNEITGKKYSEVITIIESKSGVKDVTVEFAPFWVFSTPEPSKITINIDITQGENQ